jgi:hypothetical protein
VLSFGVFAQDDYSAAFEQEQEEQKTTQGSEYFPKAGDFGIGFDATPFLYYLGNAFNGTEDNSLNLNDNTLYFRYFLSDNSAARVALRINSTKKVDNRYVRDDAAFMEDPLSQNKVEDRAIYSRNNYELKLGYQVFRGENRLRGFFGADLFLGYSKENNEYEYGNQMTVLNPIPTSAFGSGAERQLTHNYGSKFSVGVGAFTGAEYYFMSKACLGVELGLLYGQSFEGQSNESYETMVESIYVTGDREFSPGDRYRHLQTSMPSAYGNLYLMIHF